MHIVNYKGAAGGGMSLPVPFPLNIRQRRRTAFKWILDAVGKRTNRGSGKDMLGRGLGDEIIAIVQGTSSLWDKRMGQHKQATLARANVTDKPKLKKRLS